MGIERSTTSRLVTVDLIWRSWVRFPPRSKEFFFASCVSLFPFTRANAQWVIHGLKYHLNLHFRANSLFHQNRFCLSKTFTSSVSLVRLAVWWIASSKKVRSLLSFFMSWNNTWANQFALEAHSYALEAVCFCLKWHLAHSIKACSGLGSTFSLPLQQDR